MSSTAWVTVCAIRKAVTVSWLASKDSGKITHSKAVADEHDSSNDTGSDGEAHKTSNLLKDKRRRGTRTVSTTYMYMYLPTWNFHNPLIRRQLFNRGHNKIIMNCSLKQRLFKLIFFYCNVTLQASKTPNFYTLEHLYYVEIFRTYIVHMHPVFT